MGAIRRSRTAVAILVLFLVVGLAYMALAEVLGRRVPGASSARRVDGTVVLEVSGGGGVLPTVISMADEAGHTITDLSIAEPTLETVFINLTGKDLRD